MAARFRKGPTIKTVTQIQANAKKRLRQFRDRSHFSRDAKRIYEKAYYSHASSESFLPETLWRLAEHSTVWSRALYVFVECRFEFSRDKPFDSLNKYIMNLVIIKPLACLILSLTNRDNTLNHMLGDSNITDRQFEFVGGWVRLQANTAKYGLDRLSPTDLTFADDSVFLATETHDIYLRNAKTTNATVHEYNEELRAQSYAREMSTATAYWITLISKVRSMYTANQATLRIVHRPTTGLLDKKYLALSSLSSKILEDFRIPLGPQSKNGGEEFHTASDPQCTGARVFPGLIATKILTANICRRTLTSSDHENNSKQRYFMESDGSSELTKYCFTLKIEGSNESNLMINDKLVFTPIGISGTGGPQSYIRYQKDMLREPIHIATQHLTNAIRLTVLPPPMRSYLPHLFKSPVNETVAATTTVRQVTVLTADDDDDNDQDILWSGTVNRLGIVLLMHLEYLRYSAFRTQRSPNMTLYARNSRNLHSIPENEKNDLMDKTTRIGTVPLRSTRGEEIHRTFIDATPALFAYTYCGRTNKQRAQKHGNRMVVHNTQSKDTQAAEKIKLNSQIRAAHWFQVLQFRSPENGNVERTTKPWKRRHVQFVRKFGSYALKATALMHERH
ncbi:hypothetical protein CLF_108903 [Clonorchis sinensis]|uniref:Uncharacterized protein n=1 Tax=Clonorchis sinensis TaxID=79923 RepID=G7YS02_CLOSI|nr:hypothetical protein CLF_108903 [Clonorchis sinensis]